MFWAVFFLSSALTCVAVNPRLNHWRAGWKQRKALSKTGLHLVQRLVCAGHLSSVFCRPTSTHYYSEILAQIIRGEVHLFWIKVKSFCSAIFFFPKVWWMSLLEHLGHRIYHRYHRILGGFVLQGALKMLWFQPPAWAGQPHSSSGILQTMQQRKHPHFITQRHPLDSSASTAECWHHFGTAFGTQNSCAFWKFTWCPENR